jgi:hypothetical protein
MKNVTFICCEACDQSKEKPVCRLLDKVIDDPKLILDNCPLDKIDEKGLVRMQTYLEKDINEVTKELNEYLILQNDEMGEYLGSLIEFYMDGDYMSDKFKVDVEQELRYQLFIFDNCFKIEETERILPERKIIEKELVQTHWFD